MIEYKDMHWEENKLFYGKKDTTIELYPSVFEGQYHLRWNFDKPEESVNFYNITNAKDNARVLYLRHRNNTAEKPLLQPRGAI